MKSEREDRRVRGSKRQAVVERAGGRCEYCRCPEFIGTQKVIRFRRVLYLTGEHPPEDN